MRMNKTSPLGDIHEHFHYRKGDLEKEIAKGKEVIPNDEAGAYDYRSA
jgi:hypothetical protein